MADEKTTREIMDKIYAMTPEEVNQFLADNFRRMCSRPLPTSDDADVSTTGEPK